MSRTTDSYYTLYNNPFLLSTLIIEFYRNYKGSEKNSVLLSYLVFPITLYEESKNGLQRANGKRSLRSFIQPNRIYGLSERIIEFRRLTNLSLQLAVDQKAISIDECLRVNILTAPVSTGGASIEPYLKATVNLAIMLSKNDIVSIYRTLGIKQI